jgi:hypothetical protein
MRNFIICYIDFKVIKRKEDMQVHRQDLSETLRGINHCGDLSENANVILKQTLEILGAQDGVHWLFQ